MFLPEVFRILKQLFAYAIFTTGHSWIELVYDGASKSFYYQAVFGRAGIY